MLGNLGEKWDKERMLLSNWLLYVYLRRLLLVMSLLPNRIPPPYQETSHLEPIQQPVAF